MMPELVGVIDVMKEISIETYNSIDLDKALELQLTEKKEVLKGRSKGKIFILSHEPMVFTIGRFANNDNLLEDITHLEEKGYQVRKVSRGGDITVHEPGQAVIYFVVPVDSKGAKDFILKIMNTLHDYLETYSIESYFNTTIPGLWVGKKKICSVGFDFTEGVSMHGVALNVSNTLEGFSYINPCGDTDARITTMTLELGRTLEINIILEELARWFQDKYI